MACSARTSLRTRDKTKVESGVQVVERWIVAALRNWKFFNLSELNQAIRELLVRLNERPFRKRDGSRAGLSLSPPRSVSPPLTHDNLRGADYFAQGGPRSC
jgi:hypothetical protein